MTPKRPNPTALTLSFLALLGCGRGGEHPRIPAGSPVLLISIDTLRSDRLPAYGYREVETPAIDRLRSDGILFERAYTHVPLTLPAHASILTGRLPGAHGVRDNVGYDLDPAKTPALAGALKRIGYATGAAVSSYAVRGSSGLSAGFDWYEDAIEFKSGVSVAGLQRPGTETLSLALRWLEGVWDRPFFLFFHIYEPHTPYTPPEPFRSRYAASPYDGEVAASDAIVGGLLDALRARGIYDRATILLLSDHGEGLGDHGEDEHGVFLYRSTLQVPLLLKLPGGERAGTAVSEPVQLVDVVPTVLALLGAKPEGPMDGRSLLDSPTADRDLYAETFYPRLHFGWSDLASVIRGRHHYIRAPRPELYDLVSDPGETRNLHGGSAALADDLAGALERFATPLEAPTAVDEETRRRMAALGYVGTQGSVLEGDLPDPKDQTESLEAIREAFRLYGAGRYGEAVPALRAVLASNPKMLDGWEALARSLEAIGRAPEGVEAYREALRVSGGAPTIALGAATLMLRLGMHEDAAEHARLAVAADPAAAGVILSRAALRRGRIEEAEREALRAVEARGPRFAALVALAEVRAAQGRFEEALALTDRIQEEYNAKTVRDPFSLRGVALLRGRVLADLGDPARAAAAFEQEIEMFPDQTAAYGHLAVLLAMTGQPAEARRAVGRMIGANPIPAAYAEGLRVLRALEDREAFDRLRAEAKRKFPGDPRFDAGASPRAVRSSGGREGLP